MSKAEQFYSLMQDLWQNEDVRILCKMFFDIELTPYQEQIVRNVAFTHSKRTIICCMTRYGKSFCVSLGILLWIFSNPNKKVAIIAPTSEKTTIIRNYIASFISHSTIFSNLIDLDKTGVERIRKEVSKRRMTWKNGTEMRTLSAEGQGEQLMGFGADLVVVDEECSIDYEVYRSKITRMLGESSDAAYVGIGNPWHRDNQMWQHWIDPNWNKIHIGYDIALKEGRVSESFIEEQKATLTDVEFEILYKAEFPLSAIDSLISWEWIDAASKKTEMFAGEVIAGLDVAEMGMDLTVITIGIREKATGRYRVIFVDSWSKIDLMPTVAKTLPLLQQHGVSKIMVDATGVGSGVYSRLEELKREGKIGCRVEAFKGGLSPEKELERERFLNLKAQSYWHLRKLFEDGKVQIPKHREMISQLSKQKWELTSSEKIRIRDAGEKEGDTAERKSPDFADSLNLMCWEGTRSALIFANVGFKK